MVYYKRKCRVPEVCMEEIIELLNSEKTEDVLSMLNEGGREGIRKMSDFEKFAFLCQSMPYLIGNRLKIEFLEKLKSLLGYEIGDGFLLKRENQKLLWRCIFAEEKLLNITKNNISTNFELLEQKYAEIYNINQNNTYFDIDAFLGDKKTISVESTEQLVKKVLGHLESNNIDIIFFNVDEFLYKSPNEYSSKIIYNKISSGEKCNKSEISEIKLWLLISLLKHKKFKVLFNAKESFLKADSIMLHLERAKAYADFSLCFDGGNEKVIEEAALLCTKKNISSEIILSEEMDIEACCNNFDRLSYLIPLTRILPCASVHTDRENKKFSQILCGHLKKNLQTQSEAEALFKAIAEGKK